jgi:pimeloyl-ACP methyl ester carboxylesterase
VPVQPTIPNHIAGRALAGITLEKERGMVRADECVLPESGCSRLEMREFYVGDEHPMYVQEWWRGGLTDHGAPRAILVHGGAHTGVCWTSSPDGRAGWAKLLAEHGWRIFVVDWPGVGRSRHFDDFLEVGATSVVSALCALLRQCGPAVLVGHSMGAALSAKTIETVPELVEAFIAVAPAPPLDRIAAAKQQDPPSTRPVKLDDQMISRIFANADRFPHEFLVDYRRSLCDTSPAVANAIVGRGDHSLVINSVERLTSCPTIVLAGDQDDLTPPTVTEKVADFLGADYVLAGRDWGIPGFGHMIPIEIGSEQLLDKLIQWYASVIQKAKT